MTTKTKNFRFVVTHINKQGLRSMTRAVQGRNTHETSIQAQTWLNGFLDSRINSQEQIEMVFGKQALDTFEVTKVECYPVHNDPKGRYFS